MSAPLSVLIVEDRPADAELMLYELRQAGFEPTWQRVETEQEYLAKLDPAPDLILADYSLPQFDALSAFRLLNERGLDVPFIIVSGAIGEDIAVSAMKEGAADYLLKDRLARLGQAATHALEQKRLRDEKKQTEATLRESEAKFRRLAETTAAGVFIYQGTKFRYVNPAVAEKMTGYTQEELLAMDISDVVHPNFRELVRERALARQRGEDVPSRYEVKILTKSGQELWVDLTAGIIEFEGGIAGLGTAYDITERKRAEEALRESEEKFRTLAETTAAGVFIYQGTKLLYVNPVMAQRSGYKLEELLAMDIMDIVHPDFRDLLREREIARQRGQDVSPRFEIKIVTKGGEELWLDLTTGPIEFGGGLAKIGTAYDITERKRAEEALKESEAKFRRLAETTAAGVFIYKGNRFLYVNPVMALKSGYTEEELLSMDVMDIVHPDFRGLLEERDLARERGQEVPPRLELKIVTKSGEERWLDITTGPIEFEGELVGVGTAYDITERKKAEEALRKAEEKYRSIFENSLEGIFQTTPEGRYITANPALARMFGYSSPEELVAGVTDIERQFYVDPNRRAEFKKRMEEGGEVIGFESQIYRKDGSVIWISENARAVRDEWGKVFYYEGFIGDITARKRAEEQIQRQVQRLGALRSIDAAISGSLDLRVTFDVLLDQVTSRLGVDAADVLLMNPHAQMLEYAAGRGFRSPALQHTRLRLGEGYAGRALLERRIIAIADLRSQTHDLESGQSSIPNLKSSISNLRSAIQNEEFIAYYAAPLIAKGQIKGVLEIFHRSSLSPDPEWLNFLEALSAQAAIAVDNAELFNNLQRSNVELTLAYDTTLEGWSRALDLRDKETEGHTQRVTEMTMRLARVVGIGEAELVHVRRGALLHDIGKMGIPDGILLKPGPLTQEEQVIMCKHPVYAYEMLSPISYLKPALDIPYCHHEKWDGTGYPRMLRGEAIPLAARLFAVVDVWDALRSDRPYRSGWPGDKVKEHIQSLSGTHFDPKVAEAFLKMKEVEF